MCLILSPSPESLAEPLGNPRLPPPTRATPTTPRRPIHFTRPAEAVGNNEIEITTPLPKHNFLGSPPRQNLILQGEPMAPALSFVISYRFK